MLFTWEKLGTRDGGRALRILVVFEVLLDFLGFWGLVIEFIDFFFLFDLVWIVFVICY